MLQIKISKTKLFFFVPCTTCKHDYILMALCSPSSTRHCYCPWKMFWRASTMMNWKSCRCWSVSCHRSQPHAQQPKNPHHRYQCLGWKTKFVNWSRNFSMSLRWPRRDTLPIWRSSSRSGAGIVNMFMLRGRGGGRGLKLVGSGSQSVGL